MHKQFQISKYVLYFKQGVIYKLFIIKILLIFAIVTLVLTLSVLTFLNNKNHKETLKNPSAAAQTEQKILIDKINKLVSLPKDETPTIATVYDMKVLRNQQFYAKAKEGNIVLTYPKNKIKVLYDPITNKIINVDK